MRPLELVIEGFRSHAARATFDWRGRRLVGIVGPIGSGKSSILDAIAFALYSKTPVFERDRVTLINQRADRARVELAFEVEGGAWRSIRILRRKGHAKHALLRYDAADATAEPIETLEGERAVNERIERLLGLDFHAFCRSVLLAQGRFAEFLHATAGDRDKVLKGIFGLDRVDAMHARARERRRAAELAVTQSEGRLTTAAEDRVRLEDAARRLAETKARAEALVEVAEVLRPLEQRLGELAEREASARAEGATIAAVIARFPSAEEIDRADVARVSAQKAIAAAGARSELAERSLGSAMAEQASCARWVERAAAEGAAKGAAAVVQLDAARVEAEASIGRARARVDALTQEHGSPATLDELAKTLERGRLLGEAAEVARREAAAGEQDEAAAHEAAKDARAERRGASDAVDRAIAARDEANAARALADDAVMRAEAADRAAAIRATVVVGESCPVCDAPVTAPLAATPATDALDDARQEQRAAQAALAATERAVVEAQRALSSAREAEAGARATSNAAETQRAAAVARATEADEAHAAVIAQLDDAIGIGDHASQLAAARAALDEAATTVVAAETAFADCVRDHEQAQRAAAVAADRAEVGAREAAAATDALVRLVGDDGAREALAAASERSGDLGEAEAAHREAGRAVDEARAAIDDARRALDVARAAGDEASVTAESLERRIAALAGELGEETEVDSGPLSERAAALRGAVEERGRDREAEAATVRAESAELAAQRARRLAAVGLDETTRFDDALDEARRALAVDETTVADLTRRVEAASEIEATLAAQRVEHDLYRRLAGDLTAPRFLRFLLEQERAQLAAVGSARFETLSGGRYRFADDGTFSVVDLANADSIRRADTLSGGETFLASLSLALALAELVTRGGGRLDAFFLDEGFGSLDAEHLDLALDGIERLVVEGRGRLVAVVSHVPALRERVEDLIELDKDPLTGDSIVRRGASAPT